MPDSQDRSLVGLLRELTRDLGNLFRQEVRLAKTELAEKVGQLGDGAKLLAIGGVLALAGVLVLVYALVIGLTLLLWPVAGEHAAWLAPVIVGVVFAAIGAMVLNRGLAAIRAESLVPERTAASLQKDADLAREHLT